MQVPTLQNIALFACVRHKWKQSKLPSLCADVAYKSGRLGEDASKTDDIHKKIDKINDDVSDQIMDCPLLPYNIKVQWACAFSGLSVEINRFAIETIISLREMSLRNAKFCVKKIVVSQEGYIQRIKSLLKILKDSNFMVEINQPFLIDNYVTEEMLRKVANDVLQEGKQKRTRMQADNNNMYRQAVERTLCDYAEWFYASKNFLREPDAMINLACSGNLLAITYYYSMMRTLLGPGDLLRCAIFVLKQMCEIDSEIMMFFYHVLPDNEWETLVHGHSALVINSLLNSWRYRHHCIKIYKQAIEYYDAIEFKYLLTQRNWNWEYGKYDAHDIQQILIRVWFLTPEHIQKEVILTDEVANLIVMRMDFKLLKTLCENFSADIQKRALAKVIVILFNTNKQEHIKGCVETMAYPGITVANFRDILPVEVLKDQLLSLSFDVRLPYDFLQPASFLRFFTSYFIRDHRKLNELKQSFLSCTKVLENWLANYWSASHLKTFLLWCLNDNEAELDQYMKITMEGDRLVDALEASFLRSSILLDYFLLDTLKLPKMDRTSVLTEVLRRPHVRKHVHNKSLSMSSKLMYNLSFVMKIFAKDDHQNYRDFMLSADGVESLMTMVCSLVHAEDDPFSNPAFIETLRFYKLLKSIFNYYELEREVDEKLKQHGHPNARGEVIYEPRQSGGACYDFRAARVQQAPAARRLVDARYRCLRALLTMDRDAENEVFQVRIGEYTDLTQLSVRIADMAGIHIPVVF